MRRDVGGNVWRGRASGGTPRGVRIGWRGVGTALLALALAPGLAACGAASSTITHAVPTNTPAVFPTSTPTAAPADPTGYGWAHITAGHYGSAQFAASDPQRGYLCADDDADGGAGRVFGTTSDGGQTWQLKPAPTAYITCTILVSPTDPQKLTISSINLPGDGQTAFVDAFASTDGGQAWKALPIPPNTLGPAGALWAGSNLFLYIVANKGQAASLQVSANGGAFTPLDASTLVPGMTGLSLVSALAAGTTLYLNLSASCAHDCPYIVATSDGGKTWKRIPNQSSLYLTDVEGNVLYASLFGGSSTSVQARRSTDGGATWSVLDVPVLPSGNVVTSYRVAPDGTLFTATPLAVYALRGQAWSAIPFAAGGTWGVGITAIAADSAGHPTRVLVSYDGPHPGQFSHTV
ncbi:MAG TPA: hypothetical protein VID73_12830 [Ktedonobacterales bacterium]